MLFNRLNGVLQITMPLMTFDWDETRPNFFRRYKWAFRAEYDLFEAPDVATPEMHGFIRACGGLIRVRCCYTFSPHCPGVHVVGQLGQR